MKQETVIEETSEVKLENQKTDNVERETVVEEDLQPQLRTQKTTTIQQKTVVEETLKIDVETFAVFEKDLPKFEYMAPEERSLEEHHKI